MIRRAFTSGDRGQILPLFALFLIVLLGFSALAVDVGGAYAAQRFYRSTADGAALAGAQDLQQTGSRAVRDTDRIRARTNAMDHLVRALRITGTLPAECDTSTDQNVPDTCVLPGTTFHVAIKAGRPPTGTPIVCQNCDPARSVQVTLRNASYPLTFARALGHEAWNVGVTSVAGLAFGRSYAIVTLRPPKQAGNTFVVNDIQLNGNGTRVVVHEGDVGTNANMEYSGTGTQVVLSTGYGMYYYDPYNQPRWWMSPPIPPDQIVERLTTLVPDPAYRYPAMSGARNAPTYDDARTSQASSSPPAGLGVERADLNPACAAEAAKVDPVVYTFMAGRDLSTVYCYNPGVYQSGSGSKNATITISTGQVGILKPGAYYLKSGLDVGGNGSHLVGGYEPGQPGVAIMFDQSGPGNCSSCVFSGNSATTIALNAGSKFPRGTPGVAATAAIDWDNQLVETSGPSSPTPPIPLTVLVKKDTGGPGGTQGCYIPTSPPFIEPTTCDPNKNQTIFVGGGGQLDIDGVMYAPTDNVRVVGSSGGNGTVGQIIAWTVTYSGGTTINQEGPGTQGPGTLRLDGACSAPTAPCSP
jgi:hypothetical protein